MEKAQIKQYRRKRSHMRLRKRIVGSAEKPRLAVFKSGRFVYAQVIDDAAGQTLAAASSAEGADSIEGSTKSKAAARWVGEKVAERAKEKGVAKVVFDRGGYTYHGKIREIAEGARSAGLEF